LAHTNVAAFGDDGLGSELAHLELRALRLIFRLRLVVSDGSVLVARKRGAALLRYAVGSADLHELRLGCNRLGEMRRDLRLIASRVAARILLAEFGEEQFVIPGALGAVHATARRRHKLRIALVERGLFQDEQDIRLNPELETADRKQNAFRLLPSRAPILFEASGKRLFLLARLKLGEQERVADADLIAVEGFDRDGNEVNQLEPSRDVGGILSRTRGQLFDGILRLLQSQQTGEAGGLFHWVDIGANQVLDESRFHRFGIGEIDDADGHCGHFGHLRGTVTPCSGHDLEAAFIEILSEQVAASTNPHLRYWLTLRHVPPCRMRPPLAMMRGTSPA
jgi:hypothetical protein